MTVHLIEAAFVAGHGRIQCDVILKSFSNTRRINIDLTRFEQVDKTFHYDDSFILSVGYLLLLSDLEVPLWDLTVVDNFV